MALYIDKEKYPLTPGNCIAVEPGEVHEIINDGTEELILTYFGLLVA
jgi:mannose-6-phosphate isomerase-like protein (cupin superfamily)